MTYDGAARCARFGCDHMLWKHGGAERAYGCYECRPTVWTRFVRLFWRAFNGRSLCPAFVPRRREAA